MKKTYITLVGGQTIPAYQGIQLFPDSRPDEVIIVHSDDSHAEASRVAEAISRFHGVKDVSLAACSPVDIQDIKVCANSLREEFQNDELVVNITGGTKMWTLGFFMAFWGLPHARVIYVDQTNNAIDLVTAETKRLSIPLEMRLWLSGVNVDNIEYMRFDDFTDEDISACAEIEQIRWLNTSAFRLLTNEDEDVTTTDDGSSLKMNADGTEASIDLYVPSERKPKHFELRSPNLWRILLNYGWLELKTAAEISKMSEVRDIWLGCVFRSDSGNMDINEIDIIADFGSRLVCVECKTWLYRPTDVNKFKSAVSNFSGSGSACFFVANDLMDYSNECDARQICQQNNIGYFNFSDSLISLKDVILQSLQRQNKR
ncbi:MAG: DUF1887 family protein [Muribaculaceae bacterium]|nr:DUF1887 family protein [Muribaculaceae bacterium]